MSGPSPYQSPSVETGAPPSGRSALDLRDPVGRVRVAGMVEGTSFLVLLVFSLLKRLGSVSPEVNEIGRLGVKFVGMTHGVLLMVFLLALFQAWGNRALSGKKCLMAFVASLAPFGPFLIDRRLAESTKEQAVDSAD